jgi:RNA polymerase sigma-70 factor (ECF subfamily)
VADWRRPSADRAGDFRQDALGHLDALYGFALSLTRNRPDADDLVQETYLRAFRFAHRFTPGTHLRAWLFQILRNTFLTFYRRASRELAILDKDWPDGAEDGGALEAAPIAVGAAHDLGRALAELSEEFRSVLLLADLEGFALGEIAEITDTSVGTVKSRLFRARRLLRRRLADYRPGGAAG